MLNNPVPGLGSTSEFISSGLPYVTTIAATATSSIVKFPNVSKSITIVANALSRVGFTVAGVDGTKYILCPANVPVKIDVKATTIVVRGDAGVASISVYAELTGIPASALPAFSDTSWPSVSSI